jgi:WD40 repeat protein
LALGYVDGSMKVYGISPDGLHATELFTPRGHSGLIEDLAYSPDGKSFATASDDGTTTLWEAATGQELLTLSGHDGGVLAVAFSPDGTRLATGGVDGTVRIYLLRIEDLVTLARSRLTRTWTTQECQRYLHVESCPAAP